MCLRPLISVIIPCYNVEKYLEKCLESITAQTRDNAEYIFVNDGSTDNTFKLLQEFCQGKPQYILIDQSNQGVSSARNAALSVCSGDYVYLLDGDDFLTHNAIELMTEHVADNKPDIVITERIKYKNGKSELVELKMPIGDYKINDYFLQCKIFPTQPKLLYRSSIIRDRQLRFDSDLVVGEVFEFTIRFLRFSSLLRVSKGHYFNYFIRDSSATHLPNYRRDLTIIDTIRKYYENASTFRTLASFNVTTFKMLFSFTYNKYAELNLDDIETKKAVSILLNDSTVRHCMRSVAFSKSAPLRERLLALYSFFFGLPGYLLLAKIYKSK